MTSIENIGVINESCRCIVMGLRSLCLVITPLTYITYIIRLHVALKTFINSLVLHIIELVDLDGTTRIRLEYRSF